MAQPKDIVNFRRRVKEALVQGFGNRCYLCGKEYPNYVYEFHHIDPSTKSYSLSNPTTRAKSAYPEEAKKCCMVCANCHREIEHSGKEFNLKCTFDEQIYYNTLDNLVAPFKKEREEQLKLRKEQKELWEATKPKREELKVLLRNNTITGVGRMYNVTPSSVYKWCRKFGLPDSKVAIDKYTDEEWELI